MDLVEHIKYESDNCSPGVLDVDKTLALCLTSRLVFMQSDSSAIQCTRKEAARVSLPYARNARIAAPIAARRLVSLPCTRAAPPVLVVGDEAEVDEVLVLLSDLEAVGDAELSEEPEVVVAGSSVAVLFAVVDLLETEESEDVSVALEPPSAQLALLGRSFTPAPLQSWLANLRTASCWSFEHLLATQQDILLIKLLSPQIQATSIVWHCLGMEPVAQSFAQSGRPSIP